jgi:hypothetical protein
MALITEVALDDAALTTLRGLATECDATLSQKLSVFWSDRGFTLGKTGEVPQCHLSDTARIAALKFVDASTAFSPSKQSGAHQEACYGRNSSGSLAMPAAIRHASSFVSSLAADCRPRSSSK